MDSSVLVATLGLVGIGITVVFSVVNIYLTYSCNINLEKKIRRRPLHVSIAYFTREEMYKQAKGTNNLVLSNDVSRDLKENQKYIFLTFKNESDYYFNNVIVEINEKSYGLGFLGPKIVKIIPIDTNDDMNIKIKYNNEFDEKLVQIIEYKHEERRITKNETCLHKKTRKIVISSSLSSGAFMTVQQFHKHFK